METISGDVRGDDFWRSHFLKAQEFFGSNEQYCIENGLSLYVFQTNKKRLGFTRSKKKPNAFLKVTSVQQKTESKADVIRGKSLPDAKWLAEFVKTVIG